MESKEPIATGKSEIPESPSILKQKAMDCYPSDLVGKTWENIRTGEIKKVYSSGIHNKGIHATLSVEETTEMFKETRRFIKETFQEGIDFEESVRGEEKIVNLLKPGAEKLMAKFILRPELSLLDVYMDWDTRIFYFVIKCRLFHISSGLEVAQYIASANSREEKHRYRWVWAKELPPGTDKDSLVSRTWGQAKKYRIENLTVEDQISTLVQIAEKRALVGCVRLATQTSDQFTQDVGESNGFKKPKGKSAQKTSSASRPPVGFSQAKTPEAKPGEVPKIRLVTKEAIFLLLKLPILDEEERERIQAKLDTENPNEVTEEDLFTEAEGQRTIKFIKFRQKVKQAKNVVFGHFKGDEQAIEDFGRRILNVPKMVIDKLIETQLDTLIQAVEDEKKRQSLAKNGEAEKKKPVDPQKEESDESDFPF